MEIGFLARHNLTQIPAGQRGNRGQATVGTEMTPSQFMKIRQCSHADLPLCFHIDSNNSKPKPSAA